MKSIFEQMGGTYSLGKDGIYYPNLALQEEEQPHYGKYGQLRKNFLKEHRQGIYLSLLVKGELTAHLNATDAIANDRIEMLTGRMQEEQRINEELKACDQLAWIGALNNIRHCAEEIVLHEIIFA